MTRSAAASQVTAAGIFELVPIVGPFAGGAVGVALALTRSPLLAAATVVLFLGIHVLPHPENGTVLTFEDGERLEPSSLVVLPSA